MKHIILIVAASLFITKYQLLYPDWRGYLTGGFALVWIANIYMSLFGFVRVGLKRERVTTDIVEMKLKEEQEKAE